MTTKIIVTGLFGRPTGEELDLGTEDYPTAVRKARLLAASGKSNRLVHTWSSFDGKLFVDVTIQRASAYRGYK